jgi:hypothetical protein
VKSVEGKSKSKQRIPSFARLVVELTHSLIDADGLKELYGNGAELQALVPHTKCKS